MIFMIVTLNSLLGILCLFHVVLFLKFFFLNLLEHFFLGGLPILLDFVCLWIRQRATYLSLK